MWLRFCDDDMMISVIMRRTIVNERTHATRRRIVLYANREDYSKTQVIETKVI